MYRMLCVAVAVETRKQMEVNATPKLMHKSATERPTQSNPCIQTCAGIIHTPPTTHKFAPMSLVGRVTYAQHLEGLDSNLP